tara:strand:+ start:42 stop:494 length:453 start_codon:yes stop_codon:yes gene_type:complete
MIDPISAFGALTAAHGAIKKCVEMGRDLASASSAIEKYAKAEAELGFGKERKKKSIFGGIMDSAIEQHFKEEEQARLKKELRSLFQLYGSHGQWERLQATIARARAEHKKQLEIQARQRDAILKFLVVTITVVLGGIGVYYLAIYLKGTL